LAGLLRIRWPLVDVPAATRSAGAAALFAPATAYPPFPAEIVAFAGPNRTDPAKAAARTVTASSPPNQTSGLVGSTSERHPVAIGSVPMYAVGAAAPDPEGTCGCTGYS